jgi:alpha-1,6-mannosyltransferase
MHIVDLTLFFAPHSGGVKRYLLAKRAFLATQPHIRHTLLVPGARSRTGEAGLIEFASPRIPFGGGYRLPVRLRPWSTAIRDLKPDVIESADPYHLAWIALEVADRLGVPATAFAHSDLARLLGDRFAPVLGHAANVYLRTLYRRFDCVFAPSQLIAERLGDLGIGNIIVQPLGVDGRVFHPCRADASLRSHLGLHPDTRLLVFAGRMAHEKNIPLLLKTFALLGTPYHLLLVGGEQHGLPASNATMLPYQQDNARLARLLASCDALIHAGRHETFGMVIIEAMACARPVVAVRGGAVAELVDTSVGILAEPDDAQALADAVRALYARDRAQMGAAARARVDRDYLWDHTLPRQLQRYADLAKVHGIEIPGLVGTRAEAMAEIA